MNTMNLANKPLPSATGSEQIDRPPIPPLILIRKSNANNNNGNGISPTTVSATGYNNSQQQQQSLADIFAIKNKAVVANMAFQHALDKKNQSVHSTESVELSGDEDEFSAAGTSDDVEKPSRIRKRRYSMARIQPTRIKKVMQSDEDIGRMVASVPVAIGSAMELFADRLLQGAAEALQNSSTKTLSPIHIKQAVSRTPHFAFLEPLLRDIQMPRPTQQMHQHHGNQH